jgi:hemerythrin-like domain-containing protein
MKSTEFLKREERNVQALLDMLSHSIGRMKVGKDVPAYILKEIIELLQIYICGPHKMREEMILTSLQNDLVQAPDVEYDEIRASLRKYEKFLFKVIDAYDLGYNGARAVFARYADQYLYAITQYIRLEGELLVELVGDREERDQEMLKQFRKIKRNVRRTSERGIVRMETLRNELGIVTA